MHFGISGIVRGCNCLIELLVLRLTPLAEPESLYTCTFCSAELPVAVLEVPDDQTVDQPHMRSLVHAIRHTKDDPLAVLVLEGLLQMFFASV